MARQLGRVAVFFRAAGSRATLLGCAALLALGAGFTGASPALADPEAEAGRFNRGACAGSYPGWLRGVVDGYNESRTTDPQIVQAKTPIPATILTDAEKLGFKVGLMGGFVLGLQYGEELGRGARSPEAEADANRMGASTGQFQAQMTEYCAGLAVGLDWETALMDEAGTATVASLQEAQVAMHFAHTTNQHAACAQSAARSALTAEAKGEHAEAAAWRELVTRCAQWAADFAQMARGRAPAGRDEALRALSDVEAAMERAREAVASAGG